MSKKPPSQVPAQEPNTGTETFANVSPGTENFKSRSYYGGGADSVRLSKAFSGEINPGKAGSAQQTQTSAIEQQAPQNYPKTAAGTHWPNDMAVALFLIEIGQDRNWSTSEIHADTVVFEKNRIRTVGDLRHVSEKTWDTLSILPFVKDVIRTELARKAS